MMIACNQDPILDELSSTILTALDSIHKLRRLGLNCDLPLDLTEQNQLQVELCVTLWAIRKNRAGEPIEVENVSHGSGQKVIRIYLGNTVMCTMYLPMRIV